MTNNVLRHHAAGQHARAVIGHKSRGDRRIMEGLAMKTLIIDGVKYAPVKSNTGKRAVVVVDRGWIFAGDVTRKDGRILLTNALHVFKWESLGFSGMINNPAEAKADLRPIGDVDIPAGAEVFCVPVADGWGL